MSIFDRLYKAFTCFSVVLKKLKLSLQFPLLQQNNFAYSSIKTKTTMSIGYFTQNNRYNLVFFNADMSCSCTTKSGTVCTNLHKYVYEFCDGTIVKCCGLKTHKKQIYNQFVKNKNITYTLHRLNYSISIENNQKKCFYITERSSLDDTYHYNNPYIKISDPLSLIQKKLSNDMKNNKARIVELKNDLEELRKVITSLETEVSNRELESYELEKLLISLIKTPNTNILPSNHHQTRNSAAYVVIL